MAAQEPRNPVELLDRLRRLEAENIRLQSEVEFLRGNPTIAKGLKGESLIAKLITAQPSRKGAGHDLESTRGTILFEVKYSSLLDTISGRPIKRRVWTKLFGELGKKRYDRLLLVGDIDPRFASSYADPASPYVLFDLPYEAAVDISGGVKAGRSSCIHLSTNPLTVRSARALAMFHDFQVSVSDLQHRYASLETIEQTES